MSNPFHNQACPAPLCFPAVTDQTHPPLPKTQLSAHTGTFQLIPSRSSSSLGRHPFSNRLLRCPGGVISSWEVRDSSQPKHLPWQPQSAPAKRRKPGQQRGSRQEQCLQQGLSLCLEGCQGAETPCSKQPDLAPLQQRAGAESWPLPPAMLPGSHLPSPSNPVEGLEAPLRQAQQCLVLSRRLSRCSSAAHSLRRRLKAII